ncbi:hypothetical protein KAJ83_01465 [Marivibrio halodurans]|uniref:Uncharacterized protein n=1 Tax=Marivibrio halodurans TaxID=2039722 RepID=A0A8J7V0U3_9PROT|nr:hypothetical protein [Marivibrio halodurans]MBP5855660.1 hypothetical protein [Marivibrio halodurans]
MTIKVQIGDTNQRHYRAEDRGRIPEGLYRDDDGDVVLITADGEAIPFVREDDDRHYTVTGDFRYPLCRMRPGASITIINEPTPSETSARGCPGDMLDKN